MGSYRSRTEELRGAPKTAGQLQPGGATTCRVSAAAGLQVSDNGALLSLDLQRNSESPWGGGCGRFGFVALSPSCMWFHVEERRLDCAAKVVQAVGPGLKGYRWICSGTWYCTGTPRHAT